MFESSEQDQQPCYICKQQNDQMLMVECKHDPCINCAAKQYVENEPTNSNEFACEVCAQVTLLDSSSAGELKKVYFRLKKVQSKRFNSSSGLISNKSSNKFVDSRKKQTFTPSSYRSKQQEEIYFQEPVSQPTYNILPKNSQPRNFSKPLSPNNFPCSDHPEEQLSYFCFTCTRPICPECAIHGYHKNHEVLTTRKALVKIRNFLGSTKGRVEEEINSINGVKENKKRQFRQNSDKFKRGQSEIQKKMAFLRNLLVQKEKQLMRDIESINNSNINTLKTEDNRKDKSLSELMAAKKNIDNLLRKEDLIIMQEYAKKEEQVEQVLSKIHNEKNTDINSRVQNPVLQIEMDSLEDQIQKLAASIESVKINAIANTYYEQQ